MCCGVTDQWASVLCRQRLNDELIVAQAIQQLECVEAGVLFSKAEGIVPAPEANHGIAQVIREVNKAKKEGVSKTILFNLCGHGFVDMTAYQDYFDGKLHDHSFTDEELTAELANLEALQP